MSNRNTKTNGLFIYYDNNRRVYYDPISKKAYQMLDDDYKKYIYFKMALPISVILASIIIYYYKNYVAAIIIAMLLLIISFILFRMLCVNKLIEYTKFKLPEKNSVINRLSSKVESKKLLSSFLFFTLVSGFMIYNSINNELDYKNIALVAISSIVLLSIGFVYLLAFIKNKKSKQ